MSSSVDKPSRVANATRERLISTALQAFSSAGFDGVSARQVERLAGVERGLVAYHFGSKESLWNEAVDSLFEKWTEEMANLRNALRDISPRERGRALAIAYVRFNAAHPEFYRLLILEGLVRTARSRRLGTHLRRGEALFREISGLSGPDGAAEHAALIVRYIVLGAAGAPFAMPAYGGVLDGTSLPDEESSMSAEFIERFAEAVASITVYGASGRGEDSVGF